MNGEEKSNAYEKIILTLKLEEKEILNIPFNENREITVKVVDDGDETISLLSDWRNEYGEWFNSKFEVTFEKTKKWVNNILKNQQRILFLIKYNSQKIGHFGLDDFNAKDNSIFISDVIRGKRGFAPGLMEIVLNHFIRWIFINLKISIVRLRVFHDDEKAILLYTKCGLKKISSTNMKKITTDEGWKWIESDDKTSERFLDIMEIRKPDES